MNQTSVQLLGATDGPVVIQFDLGDEATLNALAFNNCGGGGEAVVDVDVQVYVRLSDRNYYPDHQKSDFQAGPSSGSKTPTSNVATGDRLASFQSDSKNQQ